MSHSPLTVRGAVAAITAKTTVTGTASDTIAGKRNGMPANWHSRQASRLTVGGVEMAVVMDVVTALYTLISR